MTKREEVTQAYWRVGNAVRHPLSTIKMITSEALDLTSLGDELMPSEWRLKNHMHTLKFDIIEGNTKWRLNVNQEVRKAEVYQLIQSTVKLTSIVNS